MLLGSAALALPFPRPLALFPPDARQLQNIVVNSKWLLLCVCDGGCVCAWSGLCVLSPNHLHILPRPAPLNLFSALLSTGCTFAAGRRRKRKSMKMRCENLNNYYRRLENFNTLGMQFNSLSNCVLIAFHFKFQTKNTKPIKKRIIKIKEN